jgi:hypothetical protein
MNLAEKSFAVRAKMQKDLKLSRYSAISIASRYAGNR